MAQMEEPNSSRTDSKSNKLVIIFGVAIVLALLAMAAMGGFMLGRSSVPPELVYETTTETVIEVEEVTREVLLVVTSAPIVSTPTTELIAPGDGPIAIEFENYVIILASLKFHPRAAIRD